MVSTRDCSYPSRNFDESSGKSCKPSFQTMRIPRTRDRDSFSSVGEGETGGGTSEQDIRIISLARSREEDLIEKMIRSMTRMKEAIQYMSNKDALEGCQQ
jgi:hypothetical protein